MSAVQQIVNRSLPFLYSDGHATDKFSKFYDYTNLPNIKNHIDSEAIKAKYWNSDKDLDLKRKKEAEFLIEEDIPFKCIVGFVVYNDTSKDKLLDYGITEKKIVVRRDYYF